MTDDKLSVTTGDNQPDMKTNTDARLEVAAFANNNMMDAAQAMASIIADRLLTKSKPTRPKGRSTKERWEFKPMSIAYYPFATHTKAVPGKPGTFDVAGMVLELLPAPKNCGWAIQITLDALRLLNLALPQWRYISLGLIKPILLESEYCSTCVVTFRKTIDSGVIRAEFSRPDSRLLLSLPHPTLWPSSSLRWLSRQYCCEKNMDNPTPWLGNQCHCTTSRDRALFYSKQKARRATTPQNPEPYPGQY